MIEQHLLTKTAFWNLRFATQLMDLLKKMSKVSVMS